MTTTTVPETLRAMAAHIERTGLAKGEFFARPTRRSDGSLIPLGERPCCTMGALGYETGYYIQDPYAPAFWDAIRLYDEGVAEYTFSTEEEERAAMRPEARAIVEVKEATLIYLSGYLDAHYAEKHIPTWNDAYATTQDGVVRTLRAAADAYVVEGV